MGSAIEGFCGIPTENIVAIDNNSYKSFKGRRGRFIVSICIFF